MLILSLVPLLYAILTMLVLGASMMWYQNLIIDFITDNAIGNLPVSDRTALFTADLFTPSVCLINLMCKLSG